MLSEADTTPMRATAADVLAQRSSSPSEPSPPSSFAVPSGVPRPLGRLLPTALEDLGWRRMAPGIKQFNLSDGPRNQGAFKLLHLAPGVTLSEHTHANKELTFVVRGSYTDQMGRFAAGDIADLDGKHSHKPIVDSEEPCIALIASDSPAQYRGVLARIMQPFVGI